MEGIRRKLGLCAAIAVLLLLMGCGHAGTSEKKHSHSMDEWTLAFVHEGFTLSPENIWSFYRVDHALEQGGYLLNNDDRLFVYRFASPEERHRGLLQIERQTAMIDLAYSPYVYEVDDDMIIYMARKRSPALEGHIYNAISRVIGAGGQKRQLASVKQDDYNFTLYTDHSVYRTNEPIRIWSTLTYTGGKQTVKILHAEDIMLYSIVQTDGTIELNNATDAIGINTVLHKGEVVRSDYHKGFGFDGDDPNASLYRRIAKGKDLKLPAGTYRVKAIADFTEASASGSDQGTKYRLPLTLTIKVTQ